MGCDAHYHIEILHNGEWYYVGHPVANRNYVWFSVIADVRNDEGENKIEVFSEERGLPDDCSGRVTTLYEQGSSDAHTPSYLTWTELQECEKIFKREIKRVYNERSDSMPKELACLKSILNLPFVEDLRVVFWFDN